MKECSILATSLHMPAEMWFDNLEDIWAYWNHNIDTLEVVSYPYLGTPQLEVIES